MTFSCQAVSQFSSVRSRPDLPCRADVVDEALDRAELLDNLRHDPGGLLPAREVAGDSERGSGVLHRLRHTLLRAPRHDDASSLGGEDAHRLEPDARSGARDQADSICEAEVHCGYLKGFGSTVDGGRVRIRRGITAASIALALGAPGSAEALTITDRDAVEAAVVVRINTVRSDHGLPRLGGRAATPPGGQRHARNMARYGYFSHSWSNGARFGTRIADLAGPGLHLLVGWREPLLGGAGRDGGKGGRSWMRSPGHRANILGPQWKRIGLGIVHVRGAVGTYRRARTVTIAAAEFGNRS